MITKTSVLVGLLTCSVALNLYFYISSQQQSQPAPQTTQNVAHQAQSNHLSRMSNQSPEVTSQQPKPTYPQVEPKGEPIRAQLLDQATAWLEANKRVKLEAFLQDYLKQHPQDMDFLLIEAQLKVKTQLLSDAISHYYDLLRFPMTDDQYQIITQQIHELTSQTILQLTNNYSWDILARFVEPLLQHEPTNKLFILSLAKAYAEQMQAGLMENILASLPFDDPDAQKIRQILLAQQPQSEQQNDDLASAPQKPRSRPIELTRIGDHFTVKASLSGNPLTLLVDTGASVTAVSVSYFRQLSNRFKVNYLGRFTINTAGGQVMARMYQFAELRIQHVTLENITIVVIPMTGMEQANGLLGMNFLREFDFKIDQNQSLLYLN